jgi:hypothetical protein
MHPQATVDIALRLSAIGILDRENARICGVSSPPSGTGAAVADVARTVPRVVLPPDEQPAVHGVMEEHWRTQRTHTSQAFISAMDTLRAHGGAYSCCHSSALMTGRGSSQQPGLRRRPSCPRRASPASSDKDVLRSKAAPSTGRACFRNTGRAGSTPVKSNSANGNWPSCRNTPANSPRDCSIRTAGVNRVRCRLADGDRWYEYPRYLFGNQSEDILRLCGETLDELGVAWRFSRPNTISVARREAVARLDEFVGPKY